MSTLPKSTTIESHREPRTTVGRPWQPLGARHQHRRVERTGSNATRRFRPDRSMAVLLASLFVVMVGYGSTVTVLPAHVQRVGGLADASVAFNVGLLVGVYALAGLVAGPIVGRLGDRLGRRPVLLAGLSGVAATQIAFGLATSLWSLYLLRVLGGFADATLLVTATAYVADSTPDAERPRGMAWLGTAVSLGLVAGPALTGLLLGTDIAALHLDGPSVPFVFSGLLATLVLGLSGRHLAGSDRSPTPAPHVHHARHRRGLRVTAATLGPLLVLVFAAQYGLAIFEGMFVLYARDRLTLSLAEISLTFIACNAVVAVMQLPAVDWLSARVPRSGKSPSGSQSWASASPASSRSDHSRLCSSCQVRTAPARRCSSRTCPRWCPATQARVPALPSA